MTLYRQSMLTSKPVKGANPVSFRRKQLRFGSLGYRFRICRIQTTVSKPKGSRFRTQLVVKRSVPPTLLRQGGTQKVLCCQA